MFGRGCVEIWICPLVAMLRINLVGDIRFITNSLYPLPVDYYKNTLLPLFQSEQASRRFLCYFSGYEKKERESSFLVLANAFSQKCKVLLKSNTYLVESGLASFAYRIKSILVQAARRRYGSVIVKSWATVCCPIVVAKVVHSSMASAVNEAVFTYLLI